jgi:hypothetical protein
MGLRMVRTALAAAGLVACLPAAARAEGFKLVANASIRQGTVSRALVTRIFLRMETRLPGGTRAQPIEQAEGSALRDEFTRSVIRRTPQQLQDYWQRVIFEGRALPPPARAGDEAVLAFVRAIDGAIGYVSAQTPTPGVRVLVLAD